jgi:glycogen synthase
MVVLQLGPFPPPHGGVQTNLVAIRDHLRRHGARSPVINLTRHRRASSDDVYYPRSPYEVLKLLLTIPADVVHLHVGGEFTPRLLGLALACTLLPGRRAVLTLHSGGYPTSAGGRSASRRSLRGWILRRLDAVIAVNAEIEGLFRSFGVDERRIELICPFAPVTVPADVTLPAAVQHFRASHTPLLTTVGLLEPEYDLALQIRTLSTVRQSFPQAGLAIVGSGSLEAELRQLVASVPDGQHVLLCGDVPHAATLRLLSESDVFLRTTLYDGDSVSVREALQLGVPAIATDNGMRPAGVHLIPRSDEAALIRAVSAILDRPGRPPVPDAGGDEHLGRVLRLYQRVLGARALSHIAPPTVS